MSRPRLRRNDPADPSSTESPHISDLSTGSSPHRNAGARQGLVDDGDGAIHYTNDTLDEPI